MKSFYLILSIFCIAILFSSCSDSGTSSSNTGPSSSQNILVVAEHDNSYYNGDSTVDFSNTYVEGLIVSDVLPNFISFKAGDSTYTEENFYEFVNGGISFDNRYFPILSNFTPLNVEVTTSIGSISGSISLPDTVTNVTFNESDTLQLGNPLTISWTGNANSYYINGYYYYVDAQSQFVFVDLDTIVTGTSVTYSNSIFVHDGEISISSIIPNNGPISTPGATANMTGDGSGFLYYINYSGQSLNEEIIVGSGLLSSQKMVNKPTKNDIKAKFKSQIAKNLGIKDYISF